MDVRPNPKESYAKNPNFNYKSKQVEVTKQTLKTSKGK